MELASTRYLLYDTSPRHKECTYSESGPDTLSYTDPYQQTSSAPPQTTMISDNVLTIYALHQQNAQQPLARTSPKHNIRLKENFDKINGDALSQVQVLSAADQEDRSPMERVQLSQADPFSQYSATFPQLFADEGQSHASNSFVGINNEHNYGTSSTITAQYCEMTMYPQGSREAMAFVPEKQYNVWQSAYTQNIGAWGNSLAGVGAQFDSYQHPDDATLTGSCDALLGD